MRVLFFGYRDMGAQCLKYLAEEGEDILGVVVPPDDRGEDDWCLSVRKTASEYDLLVLSPVKLKSVESIGRVKDLKPDIIFSCYYPKIIPKDILNVPIYGGINFHGGLLPKYRGCFSGPWSIINEEKESGVTMHYMDAQIDTGNIIAVRNVSISDEDTGLSLYHKVAEAAVSLFKEKYPILKRYGRIESIAQDYTAATYYGRAVPFDGRIDWGKDGRAIYNLVRALYFPSFKPAFTTYKRRELLVWEAKEIRRQGQRLKGGKSGQIVDATPDSGVLITTRDGHIALIKAGWRDNKGDFPLAYDMVGRKELSIGNVLS